jgi:hypothetical protein
MPLPTDRPTMETLSKRADELEKRFDQLLERKKINDAADDEDEDEDKLCEPAEQAGRATPGSDIANPDIEEPWYK